MENRIGREADFIYHLIFFFFFWFLKVMSMYQPIQKLSR